MLYGIWYTEEYGKYYQIEAESEEQAEERLTDSIQNGTLDGPDECINSHMTITKEENMKEYKIVPKTGFYEMIKANSPEEAIINFATSMDTDMNKYFDVIEKEKNWRDAFGQ